MTNPLYTFPVPTPAQSRDTMLRTLRNGLILIGVKSPNVSQGSDYWALMTAVANELAAPNANAVIASDQSMPDTAVGADLDRWLTAIGLPRRPATGSAGLVTLSCSLTTAPGVFIAAGTQLVDTAQLRYQVVGGGSYYKANKSRLRLSIPARRRRTRMARRSTGLRRPRFAIWRYP